MLKKILLSTVLTFTLSLSSVALAGGAGLTAKQIQQLKSLGFPIILPAIVPQGFKVANFEVTDSTDKGKRYTSYFISYEKKLKNKKLTEFTLHGLNGQLPNSQYAPSTLVNSSIANFIMYVDPLDGNFNYKQKLNNCVLTD